MNEQSINENTGHKMMKRFISMGRHYFTVMLVVLLPAMIHAQAKIAYQKIAGAKPRNIIFILSDDHRYDFMGFTGKVPGLQTPNLDRLAHEGAHFENAFVTTALCSPSRASILTGQY